MAEILKVELMDENGNTYYLKTDSGSVFCTDGSTVETKLNSKINTSNIIQNAVTNDSTKVPSAAVAKNLQDQISALGTQLGHYTAYWSDWTTNYTFTLTYYGHYVLFVQKGSSSYIGIVFNYADAPAVYWATNTPTGILIETSKNKLTVKSSDTTAIIATVVDFTIP